MSDSEILAKALEAALMKINLKEVTENLKESEKKPALSKTDPRSS